MKTTHLRVWIIILSCAMSCPGRAGDIVVCAPEDVGMSGRKLGVVTTAVQGLVDEEKIAGASVLVARQGKVAFFKTFGIMDQAAEKPIQEDTLFRFYSMTKPITSVAAMMLVEQGKIKLDEPVSTYVKPFAKLKVYDKSDAPVALDRPMTVRDLLRHTSGLTYGYFGNTAVDKLYLRTGVLNRYATLSHMVDRLAEIPLLYQPGTRWHYSVATDVLGHLVETVSGVPLDVFFQQKIFEPLGMTDTTFYVSPEKVSRFAVCYGPAGGDGGLRVSDNPTTSQFLTPPTQPSGGGGLLSTMPDYLKFCAMLLNRGELNGKRLLRASTVDRMTRNHLPDSTRANGQGFGLGVSVQLTGEEHRIGEYGWGGAASTHFWINPDKELIVIALSQLRPYSSQLQKAVSPLVYQAIME